MPHPKEELPEQLRYIPWWRKGDPGPDWPWVIEDVSPEIRLQLVISQLQYEADVAAAATKAIQRNITILTAGKRE